MLASAIIATLFPLPVVNVLLIGNSHTAASPLPYDLKRLSQSDNEPTVLQIKSVACGLLQDAAQNPLALKEIRSQNYRYVVLQGAGLSTSHKHKHPQDGAVSLVQAVRESGATPILFAEWPRKGWDETGYILGVYQEIAEQAPAEILKVCETWDAFRRLSPDTELWANDRNHASRTGFYLAAYSLYRRLQPQGNPTYRPDKVSPEVHQMIQTFLHPKETDP